MSAAAAVAAARQGWHVFPCQAGGKRPLVTDWERRACADPERVAQFWPAGANVGIACGPSRLVVVDLDTHGQLPDAWAREPGVRDGLDVFTVIAARAGVTWPATCQVRTPSAGRHLYFTAPPAATIRNSAGRLGPLVDVRAAGGFVIGAGSSTEAGTWEYLIGPPPALLPPWLWHLLERPMVQHREAVKGTKFRTSEDRKSRLGGLARAVRAAPEGRRNETLNWAAWQAGELVRDGEADRATVAGVLREAAGDAGLPAAEISRTLASALGGDR